MGRTSELTNRGAPATLPASPGAGSAGALTQITQALPALVNGPSAWRVVELWSTDNVPWQATIEWSGGAAGLRKAQVLVPRATRVCVNANALTISGANLSTVASNNVWAAVEDGYGQYENQWVVGGATTQATTVEDTPPPFARFVRLELSDDSRYPTSFVELYDASGTLRARYAADKQPNPGVPVGDAAKLRAVISGATSYRFTYLLGL